MMRRRQFITLLGGPAAAWPIAARAQQTGMPIIGILAAPASPHTENVSAIRRGLGEAGFVEGRNLAMEFRWAEGHLERLPALAADLVNRQVALIVTVGGTAPLAAARNATSTIPIVFHMGADPVSLGFVRSFNRPGGNVTGVSLVQVALAAKRLEMLRELVPATRIIGLLINPANPNVETVVPELHTVQEGSRAVQVGPELVHLCSPNASPGHDGRRQPSRPPAGTASCCPRFRAACRASGRAA